MWLIIKQLLEQGISLTTDPYPSSPKFPSNPGSYPSHSISWVPDNFPTNTVVLRSESSKSMVDDSVCLPKLDSLALAQRNVDELKYESARLAQQIQQLPYKLNVPQSCTDMAPELVRTDLNYPCTKAQANISRSEFVPQDLDSSATDLFLSPLPSSVAQKSLRTISQVHCPHSLPWKREPLVSLRSYNKPVVLFIPHVLKTPSLLMKNLCLQTQL